jgi:hypothetical protein
MMMGPTFENISLGDRASSFQGLTRYGEKAIDAANMLIAELDVNEVVKDVKSMLMPHAKKAAAKVEKADADLIGVFKNVIYYVQVAISSTGTNNAPMHLPDVGPYWTPQR